jgi:pimeloyl-ACP methyl ester carboxylesterase
VSEPARRIPEGAREEIVEAAGGRFRLLRSVRGGPGTPILLVHGGGSDNAAISWYRLIEPLSQQRPVLAPDLAGFGYTEGVPITGAASAMADHLRALLDTLGIAQVVICGVSMGGEVAMQFALRHPEACVALIVVAPGGLIARYRSPLAHTLAWAGTRLPDPLLRPFAAVANRFTRAIVRRMVANPATIPAAVLDEMAREARRPNAGYAYARYNKAAIGPREMRNNLLPRVEEIAVPTLFFHGTADPLVAPAGSIRAAQAMDDARLVLVPNCGHWAQLEAHDRFLAEVRSFLRELGV